MRHGLADGNDASVLMVEDHLDTLEGYMAYLKWCGLRVDGAASGEQALDELHTRLRDVVVIDMKLPGLSGWDTVKAIRQDPYTRDVAVVAFTALASIADRSRAVVVGCDAFVAKPCYPWVVAQQISRVLTRKWSVTARAVSRAGRAANALQRARARTILEDLEKTHSDLARSRGRLGEALSELKGLASITPRRSSQDLD
jgi:CheY-like chemotaxis protein